MRLHYYRLFLFVGIFLCVGLVAPLSLYPQITQEELPESAQEELERQGMTLDEAMQQAQMLGIDLSNPQAARSRAQQLGIPESTINEWLQAVQGGQTDQGMTQTSTTTQADVADWFPTPTIRDTAANAGTIRTQSRRDTLIVRGDTLVVTSDTLMYQNRVYVRNDTTGFRTAERALPYFGYSFFENVPEAFQPGQMGPVDEGYIVGPGDELRLTVWGATEFQYELTVDREGRIYVPNVGQLTVAGKSLEDLRQETRQWLSQNYAGLVSEPPTAFMDLTVTRLRPIYVYVLGDVRQPGGYTISSYSTVFNVLYSVGGPLASGSLRDIRVIRDGEVVAHVDMYDHLLRGYESDPVRLQNNDRIFIPPRGKTVSIRGPVRRPAIFEMLEEEGFSELLEFAGGLKPEAYVRRFQITRIIPFAERTNPSVAREVLDLNLAEVMTTDQQVPLYDGDRVVLGSILSQLRNSAQIEGAVAQPGPYEIDDQMRTVRDLVLEADSLTGDAYIQKADLVRVQSDSTQRMISVNLERALGNDPYHNLPLQPMDSLYVYSTLEMIQKMPVRITGQVRNAGPYPYLDSMTVTDLLYKGGGLQDEEYLKDVYLERADLFRKTEDGQSVRIIPFHLGDALQGEGLGTWPLQPEDEIRIYPKQVTEFVMQEYVDISVPGEYDPGRYHFAGRRF